MSIKPYKSKFGDGRSANPPITPGGRQVYLITHVIARLGPPGYEANVNAQTWRNFQITWSGKINLAGSECTTPCNFEFK